MQDAPGEGARDGLEPEVGSGGSNFDDPASVHRGGDGRIRTPSAKSSCKKKVVEEKGIAR